MAYRPSAGRNLSTSSVPKVPNLVPIMNLFLTIIPFLILMLVISQVALVAFNFSDGTPGGEGNAGGGEGNKELLEATVIIMASADSAGTTFPGFEIRLNPATPGVKPDSLALVDGQYDYLRLQSTLAKIKEENPNLRDISVAPFDDVTYDALIKTIDVCRSIYDAELKENPNLQVNIKYKAPQVRYYGRGN